MPGAKWKWYALVLALATFTSCTARKPGIVGPPKSGRVNCVNRPWECLKPARHKVRAPHFVAPSGMHVRMVPDDKARD